MICVSRLRMGRDAHAARTLSLPRTQCRAIGVDPAGAETMIPEWGGLLVQAPSCSAPLVQVNLPTRAPWGSELLFEC